MENKVKILVVEDEFIIAEEISEILKNNGYDVIGTVANCIETLEIISTNKPDVILLDIHIDGPLDGIETAVKIRKEYNDIAIIYLTAFSDENFVKRAKETNPAAYIVKPFDERNLLIAIELAFSNLQNKNIWEESSEKNLPQVFNDRIYIKDNHRHVKLMIADIKYIEAIGSYCEIITTHKKYSFSFTLKHLSSKFSHELLCRVHRSFVINMDKIDGVQGNQVFIGDKNIPIGNQYKESIRKRLNLI